MLNPAYRFDGLPAPLPLTFTVDEDEYTLPELDTRTWLDALVLQPPACWMHLIPTRLAGDGATRIGKRLAAADDDFDLDDLERVAEDVLRQVCGMDFYAAHRLAAQIYGNWQLYDGWCASKGVDPLHVPISRVLSAAYAWRLSLCQEKSDIGKLDASIYQPPPPMTVSGKPRDAVPAGWNDDVEEASFLAALETLGGRRSGDGPA